MIDSDYDIIVNDNTLLNNDLINKHLNTPLKKVKKRKRFKNLQLATSADSITNEMVLDAKVGDIIFMEYRNSPWRDDAYFKIESIDFSTGRLGLFNIDRKCSALSNFKYAHQYGHFLWKTTNKKTKAK